MFVDQGGALWLSEPIGLLLALGVCLAIGLIHVACDARRPRAPHKPVAIASPRRTAEPTSLGRYRRERRAAAPPLGPYAA
jgi:hypothetical protein